MSKRFGDPRFYTLLDEMADLHSRKNHDYSRQDEPLSNFRRSAAFGVEPWRGILVRMSDKWSRMEELSKGKQPKNESLRDSLIDNAVYSLLTVLLLDESEPPIVLNGSPVEVIVNTAATDALVDAGELPAICRSAPTVGMTGPNSGWITIQQTEGGFGYVRAAECKMGPKQC